MFNSLKYAKQLIEAGFSREQAEAQMQIMGDLLETKLAMKQDLLDLRTDMQSEFRVVRSEMQMEFQNVRSEMALGFEKFESRLAKFEAKLIRSMVGTMAVLLTIFSVLNKFLI